MRKALALIFALTTVIACQPAQPAGEQAVSVIVESAQGLTVSKMWYPGDSFYATIRDLDSGTWYHDVKFNYDGSMPASRGWFSAKLPAGMRNAALWANIPSQKGADRDFNVDISSQAASPSADRQPGCVEIVAKKDFISGGKVADILTFQPLTSALKFHITNSDAAEIVVKHIEVAAPGKIFSSAAHVVNTSSSTDTATGIQFSPVGARDKVGLDVVRGELAAGGEFAVAMHLWWLAKEAAEVSVTVSYSSNGEERSYVENVTLNPMERGQMQTVEIEVASVGNVLKLMSSNIRLVTSADTGDTNWSVRKTAYVNMLAANKADVVGIQEIRDEQASFILQHLGDVYAYCSPRVDGIADSNCGHTGLLYNKVKFTLLDKGYFWLSDTPDKPSTPKNWGAADLSYRTCYWVHLKSKESGKTFFYFTSHLPYKSEDTVPRKKAAELCLSRMKAVLGGGSEPIFFGGDMNIGLNRDGCLDPVYAWMGDAREKSPSTDWSGTFNKWGASSSCIDYIFFKNATPLTFKVDNSPNYGVKYVSDHYPIIFTAKIK